MLYRGVEYMVCSIVVWGIWSAVSWCGVCGVWYRGVGMWCAVCSVQYGLWCVWCALSWYVVYGVQCLSVGYMKHSFVVWDCGVQYHGVKYRGLRYMVCSTVVWDI